MRSTRLRSGNIPARSNSLPRTFNREALLRHPELSMELDRLSAPEDNLSDTGESRLGIRHSARGEPDNSHLPLASDGSQKSSLPDITLTYSWHVVMGLGLERMHDDGCWSKQLGSLRAATVSGLTSTAKRIQ